jgi:hypothetical protein
LRVSNRLACAELTLGVGTHEQIDFVHCFSFPLAAAALAFACLTSFADPASSIPQGGKPASANPQKLLAITDVESAMSVEKLKLVPRGSTTGAVGDLNFAKADGSLFVMANFVNGALSKNGKPKRHLPLCGYWSG